MEGVRTGPEIINHELVRVRKNGHRIVVQLTVSPTRDQEGNIVGASTIARDITDRKRSEAALCESQEQYRLLFESNPVPMWIFDRHTLCFVAVNKAAIRQYGFSEQEFLAKTISEIHREEDIPDLLQHIAKPSDRIQNRGVWRHRKKSGAVIEVDIVAHALDFQGTDSVFVSAYDVTDRTRSEEGLRQAEEKYRAIFENSVVGIFQGTPEGRLTSVNGAFAEMVGYGSSEEMLAEVSNNASSTLVDPGLMAEWLHQVAERGVVRGVEFEFYRKDRTTKWVRGSLRAICDASGKIVLHEGTVEDISEQRRAEAMLRESESKYRLLFEESADATWLNDEHSVLSGNSAGLRMFGYSAGDIMPHPADMSPLNQPDGTLSKTSSRQKIAAALLHGKERFEWVHRRKNGSLFPAEVCLTALTLSGRHVYLATVRDVTERKQSEEVLLFKTALLEAQSETTIDGILVVDESNRIVTVNKQFGLMFEIPDEVLIAGDDHILQEFTVDKVQDPDAFVERVKYLNGNRHEKSRDELRLKNGKVFDRYSAPLVDSKGQYRGRIWSHRDITDHKRAEEALQSSQEKFRQLAENIREVFWMMNAAGTEMLYIGPGYERIWGRSCKSLYERPMDWMEAILLEDRERAHETFMRQLQGESIDSEYRISTPDGKQRWIRDRAFPIRDQGGELIRIGGIAEDITERKAADERSQFLAFHDALTGLPQRALLEDRLTTALAAARRRHEKVAVLFFDLDRFKNINDTFGHSYGDEVLKEVARRLLGLSREQDTVARMGGDEFLVMLNGVKDVADVAVAAQRLLDTMKPQFLVQGRASDMGCSIGVSIFPEHGTDGETLIRNADAAMYIAKGSGRGNVRFFTEEMNAQIVERLTMEKNLRLALARKEFFLVYQPQVEIETGKITGLEALIRWQLPEMGLVPPDRFIPIAENNGLILPIGEWVLRTACAQARKWQDDGLPAVAVAVNVSAVQFRQESFCALIRKVLQETGLAPRYLELELTEGLLLADGEATLSVLQELKEMGLRLAIDDFGTGYSSLSYLKQFPVGKLKIDRSFVRDIAVDCDDRAITSAIISMAKSLHLKVIAEGVENEAQMSFLRERQCDEIQGYYFSKPLSADDAAVKLQSGPYYEVGAVRLADPTHPNAILHC